MLKVERLKEVLRHENGKLYWKPRTNLNKRLWGKEAFHRINEAGYCPGQIDGKKVYAHQVVYALHSGHWPQGEVDHINRDKADNRPENLRVVSRSVNAQNKPRMSNNTSGHTGVYFNRRLQKWAAQIKFQGETRHLGTFADKADAYRVRKDAEYALGFHPNHGESNVIPQSM